jgi:hypothetical protein
MSELIQIYIEDHGPLGPAAYPVEMASAFDPLLKSAVVAVPREQAERWLAAEAGWAQAQREMTPILTARHQRLTAAIGAASDYQAANRAADRNKRGQR